MAKSVKSVGDASAPKIDHLNVFEPFSNVSATHENVLTRNFLILVKYIPWLREYFFKILNGGAVSKNNNQIQIYTQVGGNNEIFHGLNGFTLFSVVISDDKYSNENDLKVGTRQNKSGAIYDGVIISVETKSVFIIEDKPSRANIDFDQLCPSEDTVKDNGIVVNEKL